MNDNLKRLVWKQYNHWDEGNHGLEPTTIYRGYAEVPGMNLVYVTFKTETTIGSGKGFKLIGKTPFYPIIYSESDMNVLYSPETAAQEHYEKMILAGLEDGVTLKRD